MLSAIGGLQFLQRQSRYGHQIATRVGVAMAVVAVTLSVWKGPLPQVFVTSDEIKPYRAEVLSEIRPLVPAEASLSADYFLGSHFLKREFLYIFPDQATTVDFVLVDTSTLGSYGEAMQGILDSGEYRLVYQRDTVFLLARTSADAADTP
jgi:hypothetical protein